MEKPKNPNYPTVIKELTCQTCKKPFVQKLKRDNGAPIPKFCSMQCANPKVKTDCIACGKEYEVIPYRLKKTKYCSPKCMYGAKNEGKHPYSTKEWEEARKKALERDNYTCQICGKKQEEATLHVNHILPYRLIRSHIVLNLTTLCSSCHAKEDWNVREILNIHPMRVRFLEMLTEMWLTNLRKSNDYAKNSDPFSNFRKVEGLGITPFRGILVRMEDKISRIEELSQKEGMVAGESIRDTLLDLAVYSILAVYALEVQEQKVDKRAK